MQIKKFKFKLRIIGIDNEKWDDDILIRSITFNQAIKEMWNNLSEHLDLSNLASVTIINLAELKKI